MYRMTLPNEDAEEGKKRGGGQMRIRREGMENQEEEGRKGGRKKNWEERSGSRSSVESPQG